MKEKRSGGKTIGFILAATAFLLLSFIAFLVTWTLGYWHDITFDEIVFYLSSPLEGTAGNVINAFIFKVVVEIFLFGFYVLLLIGDAVILRHRWSGMRNCRFWQ